MNRRFSKNQLRQARRYDRNKYRDLLADMAVNSPSAFLREAAVSLLTPYSCYSIGSILGEIEDVDVRERGEAMLAEVVNRLNGTYRR